MSLKRKFAQYAAKKALGYASKKARTYGRYLSKGGSGGGRSKRQWPRTKFARAVKKVILSTAEKCYKSIARDGFSFNHDSLGLITVWSAPESFTTIFPSQGNGDGERRGDEIYAKGIMARIVFQIPYDRRNMKFKLWWVEYDEDQTGTLNKTNFFHNVSNNVIVDPVQSDRWPKCKYLGQYHCYATDQSTTGQDKTIILKKWIPMKKKITFRDDSSTIPSNLLSRGALVICCYDTITSVTTDVLITQTESSWTLYYSDP